jgi:hypothetical protein
MAKIWAVVVASVKPDGNEAEAVLKKRKESIVKTLVERTSKALPEPFSTKDSDKPSGIAQVANALKASPELTLTIETKGSHLVVTCKVKIVFDAIKSHEPKSGVLLAASSKGAGIDRRGTVDKDLDAFIGKAFDECPEPQIKELTGTEKFRSYARAQGLPI